MQLIKIFSVIIMVIGPVDSYSDGAPESVCKSMDPSKGHGALPQTTESWYYIKVNSDYYQPGHQLEVQIMLKKAGQYFEGFMLEARRVDPDEKCGEKVGTFEERNETQLICSGQTRIQPVRAKVYKRLPVTQTSADIKRNLTFIWNAPQKSSGNIQFRATLVKSEKVFWLNVVSKVIYDKSSGKKIKNSRKDFVECPVTSTTVISKPTVTSPPTSKLESDAACGDTIGCFHDCKKDGSCNFIFSWKEVGEIMEMNMKMAFSGNDQNKWMAAGFSDDDMMVGERGR
ncbi:hypothetical protein LOTGIDRAFT_237230 [Lottia gigantea]|uniref:Reelin domain-containing protein n=1 Tax=Lottia gigantea TaxID=225164 RepID=V3ZM84_LOTGI|nr:hypothetical protein LOTGIDRAFT_237230 [Lottia gigantea]ESO81941.1 hypothetical protein LOTGIDRAFT_237230 [Lottia gigantea]